MLNLSFEETVENHRKMWNWIADECIKREYVVGKDDYFKAHKIVSRPEYDCYACDFTRGGCRKCPFLWGSEDIWRCVDVGSPYDEYRKLRQLMLSYYVLSEYKMASEFARKIANLPINPEYRDAYGEGNN